jgi:hypothetical protein
MAEVGILCITKEKNGAQTHMCPGVTSLSHLGVIFVILDP